MNINVIRRKIISGYYEITQHAKEQAAEDGLDVQDIETVILNGNIVQHLTDDSRGDRFVICGLTEDKNETRVVCRILDGGKLRIITVYSTR